MFNKYGLSYDTAGPYTCYKTSTSFLFVSSLHRSSQLRLDSRG